MVLRKTSIWFLQSLFDVRGSIKMKSLTAIIMIYQLLVEGQIIMRSGENHAEFIIQLEQFKLYYEY